jgi:hypothetical protein
MCTNRFERCCTLLYNSYRPFEQNMKNSHKVKHTDNNKNLEYINGNNSWRLGAFFKINT